MIIIKNDGNIVKTDNGYLGFEITPTPTPSFTPNYTPSTTQTLTPTVTPTSTETLTPTPTLSLTPTLTPSSTPGGIIPDGLFMNLEGSSYTGGTWIDSTGNGNNGTLTDVVWKPENGGIFFYNGFSSQISIPHNINLSFNTAETKTIQVWVRFESYANVNGVVVCFQKLSSSFGFDGYYGGLFSDTGQVRTLTNGTSTQRIIDSVSPFLIVPKTWYLFTMICRITGIAGTTQAYINDTLYLSGQHNYDTIFEQNPLLIGPVGFIGQIGAAYFYTRELSPSDISRNFNNTKTRYGL